MRKFVTLLCLLFALSSSAKLTQFILRAYVEKQDYSKADWYRESVDSVFVALVQNDTVPVDFRMMSGNDDLKMTTSSELRILAQGGVGSYSLILNREGFEPLRHDFKVVSEGQDVVYIRSLLMEPKRETALNEVEVVGTAIKMVMHGDTIVYDSRAFKLAEGSTLDALVRQLPGAQLTDDGSITVNGKKVSSLLLDGNDFFQGDPEVVLKNLPAYTVDKIKVYDKAAKDDHVTLASQTLTSSPDDENIVMDVTLKKEFQMATILSVEGGYGPGIYNKESAKRWDSRYLGRAFAIGFGKNYRWGAYGGYNNINNKSKADSRNKDWGYSGMMNRGDGTVAVGGFDVFYNPTKKWELTANMSYERNDFDYEQLASSTKFYDTGNQYQRSSQSQTTLSNFISGGASMRYLGDRFTFYLCPSVKWYRGKDHSVIRWANFSENPSESSRGAALDSVFSQTASPQLMRSLTSSTYRASNSDPGADRKTLSVYMTASWRPAKGRGVFYLSASGNSTLRKEMYGQLYEQPFMADPSAPRVNRQQWTDSKNSNDSWGANINYDWDKKHIGEKWINTFRVSPVIGYDLSRDFNNNVMLAQLLAESFDPASNPLPSVTAPENIRPLLSFDENNTVKSLDLSNEMLGRMVLRYSIETAAPTDSGFNPNFGIYMSFDHRQYWRHFTYDKPYGDFHYGVNSCDPTEDGSLSMSFSSSNKLYYFYAIMNYSVKTSLRSLSELVPTFGNADPMNVYLGPEEGMGAVPPPLRHSFRLFTDYYGNKSHQRGYLSAYYNRDNNSLAQTSVFDPLTGITTHRPRVVNGYWDAGVSGNYDVPFGPQDCWDAWISADYDHTNSVDYVASTGEAERSVVKTDDLGGEACIYYKLKNGTTFGLRGGTTWQHSTSPRADFRTITAWKSEVHAAIQFYLPFNIEGQSTLTAKFRRGYEDSALNTTEWLWNIDVQKSFLKGALTVKLHAVDILGQLSDVTYSVNAQGRTETWINTLPRYAMLTLAYRFNFTPSALK
ncbi:MAG: hypothetical protein NC301_05240 [Bacteroides sp.]|nr:hypothetical protein [Bacteroides sp.]MCM1445317.1 hypothetical protein [Prevotella sp.]